MISACSNSVVPTPKLLVNAQIDTLVDGADRLRGIVDELEKRLYRVLKPSPPSEPLGSNPIELYVPIANELKKVSDTLQGGINQISYILDRLEV